MFDKVLMNVFHKLIFYYLLLFYLYFTTEFQSSLAKRISIESEYLKSFTLTCSSSSLLEKTRYRVLHYIFNTRHFFPPTNSRRQKNATNLLWLQQKQTHKISQPYLTQQVMHNRKRPEHNWQYSQLCEHIKGIVHSYGAFFILETTTLLEHSNNLRLDLILLFCLKLCKINNLFMFLFLISYCQVIK